MQHRAIIFRKCVWTSIGRYAQSCDWSSFTSLTCSSMGCKLIIRGQQKTCFDSDIDY